MLLPCVTIMQKTILITTISTHKTCLQDLEEIVTYDVHIYSDVIACLKLQPHDSVLGLTKLKRVFVRIQKKLQ